MKEIFILEDDDNIRELIQVVLESYQYSVKAFHNLKSFNHAVKESIPDMFLLDVMLPDGNGLERCEELKTSEKTRHLPVVIMSAHVYLPQTSQADDFIAKPFNIDDLIQCIANQF